MSNLKTASDRALFLDFLGLAAKIGYVRPDGAVRHARRLEANRVLDDQGTVLADLTTQELGVVLQSLYNDTNITAILARLSTKDDKDLFFNILALAAKIGYVTPAGEVRQARSLQADGRVLDQTGKVLADLTTAELGIVLKSL